MEDRLTDSVDKVPILGDIPGLGLLFQRKVQTKSKTELLVFLTPHVAKQPEDLDSMSRDEQAGTKVISKAVEKGAFEKHMEGMQRGAADRPPAGKAEDPVEGADGQQRPAGDKHEPRP
jgi:type II secretory pathway component GspD/PulD (secretin)